MEKLFPSFIAHEWQWTLQKHLFQEAQKMLEIA
jgi:hypothetical protein